MFRFAVDRVCTTGRFDDQCSQLQRGNSDVNCQRVQDSIECAQRIRNGTAEFGVFSAENALHLASLGWDGLTVVKEVRHRERLNCEFGVEFRRDVGIKQSNVFSPHEIAPVDYESVVIVRSNHKNGIEGLRGLDYCHPGFHYDRTQRWTERFLKHFERTVAQPDCEKAGAKSSAEIEVEALAQFFNKACRPGAWSNNIEEDAKLSMNSNSSRIQMR